MTQKNVAQYGCSKIAVLSDIHSNYYALKACLEDAKAAGADGYIFLGDYISGLADPVKTMDLVYEICAVYPCSCICGNRERYIAEYRAGKKALSPGSRTGTFLFTHDRLREKDIAFFESLPFSKTVSICGIPIETAHATMDNDRYFFDRESDKIQGVFQQMKTKYLLTGHSHKQYICHNREKTIINPGSVGLPQGSGNRAQYALLEVADGEIDCILRQVSYDMEALIYAQFQSGLVACGKYWALGDLYGALTGNEYTRMLIDEIYRNTSDRATALDDEQAWHKAAVKLGLCFTEKEILEFWKRENKTSAHQN